MSARDNDRWVTAPVDDIVKELAETTGGQRETWKWILYCSTMNRKRVEAEELLARIIKYAEEDRATTPGSTRLARVLSEARIHLALKPEGS